MTDNPPDKPLGQRLKNFAAFLGSFEDALLFLRIGFWVLLQPLLIKYMNMDKLMQLLTPASNSKWSDSRFEDKVLKFSRFYFRNMTPASSRSLEPQGERIPWVPERTCLIRAMVLYRFLRLAGQPLTFHLGVRKEAGKITGHSWLTLYGQFYFENEEQGYKITYSYPNRQSAHKG